MVCGVGLKSYGAYSTQSVYMRGGYWSAAYAPVFSNMSNAVTSLFHFKDAVGFAKMLSFVTSCLHCFNEAVLITVAKHFAVKMMKDAVFQGQAGVDSMGDASPASPGPGPAPPGPAATDLSEPLL